MRFGGGAAAAGSLVLPFVRAGVTAAGVVAIGGFVAFILILPILFFSVLAGVSLLSIARLPLLRLAGWVSSAICGAAGVTSMCISGCRFRDGLGAHLVGFEPRSSCPSVHSAAREGFTC